ncbi:MAG: hypothetical protein LBP59_10785 [Planctomycetaceae bacterium]|jgi:hypothetical protein|nr:hypothetical protein [Planctomycetaceae bacterium]
MGLPCILIERLDGIIGHISTYQLTFQELDGHKHLLGFLYENDPEVAKLSDPTKPFALIISPTPRQWTTWRFKTFEDTIDWMRTQSAYKNYLFVCENT